MRNCSNYIEAAYSGQLNDTRASMAGHDESIAAACAIRAIKENQNDLGQGPLVFC